jgi:hypothetical protein
MFGKIERWMRSHDRGLGEDVQKKRMQALEKRRAAIRVVNTLAEKTNKDTPLPTMNDCQRRSRMAYTAVLTRMRRWAEHLM